MDGNRIRFAVFDEAAGACTRWPADVMAVDVNGRNARYEGRDLRMASDLADGLAFVTPSACHLPSSAMLRRGEGRSPVVDKVPLWLRRMRRTHTGFVPFEAGAEPGRLGAFLMAVSQSPGLANEHAWMAAWLRTHEAVHEKRQHANLLDAAFRHAMRMSRYIDDLAEAPEWFTLGRAIELGPHDTATWCAAADDALARSRKLLGRRGFSVA